MAVSPIVLSSIIGSLIFKISKRCLILPVLGLAIANNLDTSIDFLLSDQYDNREQALDSAVLRALERFDDAGKEKILRIIEIL